MYKRFIYKKRASVLIYSILLTSIALILAMVVANNYTTLTLNQESVEIDKHFYQGIKENIDTFSEDLYQNNTDGSGVVDVLSCPGSMIGSPGITMSGSVKKAEVKSVLFSSGTLVYCLSYYDGRNLEVYFNDEYTDFARAKYNGEELTLSGTTDKAGQGVFTIDSTGISFPMASYNTPDGFDDNMNNDSFTSDVLP